jgi:hypothetical protein
MNGEAIFKQVNVTKSADFYYSTTTTIGFFNINMMAKVTLITSSIYGQVGFQAGVMMAQGQSRVMIKNTNFTENESRNNMIEAFDMLQFDVDNCYFSKNKITGNELHLIRPSSSLI